MTETRTIRILATLLTCALLAFPALAADLADVQIGSTSVSFSSAGERLSLVVTGPQGFTYETEVHHGGLAFEIFDADGNLLPNGTYHYELRTLASAPKAAERDNVRGLGEKSAERPVQSGVFTIADGSLVDPTAEEPPARETPEKAIAVTQKLVHAEDVKIQGSLCVGVDCTSSESFGFDTIRLKENNLRIKFQDTSTGSFPSNDWQLTANDTSNGGANRFSIDDVTGSKTPFTIEAGAPSNSLYVADTGEIGIGTSTPVSNIEIHVKDGDTPTLRLEQDGSSGFTAQTWDVAGNEANFFVRDVNHSSHLPFRIKPGSGNDNALYIDSDGDIGMGTTSPDQNLDIEADGPNFRLTNTGTGAGIWDFRVESLNGRLTVTDDSTATRNPFKIGTGADDNLLRVGLPNSSTVEVNGTLAVTGSVTVDGTTVHADYVFDPAYDLQSIGDHADFMWREKHLPGLPKAPEGLTGPVDITAHQMGMLEELETAHIYIEQLNDTVEKQSTMIEDLQRRLAKIEAGSVD